MNAKHVIFGTVTGATIFNAIRIGKTDMTDSDSGMPADLENAPIIKSVKIDFHPSDDIVQNRMEDVSWKIRQGDQNGSNDVKRVKGNGRQRGT